jgi:selenocysteine lyase/cysteine desulfurase
VRGSVGPYSTEDDILALVKAVEQIIRLRR